MGKAKTKIENLELGSCRTLCTAAIVAALLLTLLGCEETFNPKAAFEEQLVLCSVLTTRSDSQFVRVYTTYNPSGHNPLESSADTYVRNALVKLTVDSITTTLPSVDIKRTDKTRYTDDIIAYVAYPHALQPGKTYKLNVTSDKGNAEAAVSVPGRGEVSANNPYVLKSPDKYEEDVSSRIRLSSSTHGYLVRIILEFETRLASLVTRHREEIPSAVYTGGGSSLQFVYPILTRRNTSPFVSSELASFGLDAYKIFLVDLKSRYGAITLTGATYILTQVDRSLYTYYNLANGFQDPYSIRTDLPDYTNVQGGMGIFGALVEDSVFVDLR
jgi:hypothetical protein